MADKIKAIKIKQINGTYSEEIPISVNVQNVQWDENNHTLLDALGSVDISSSGKGNLQHQIDELDGDKISTNQFNSRLNDFLKDQISADTTDWLDDNVNPVGSAVIVDKTLTIEGAAADALAVKTELNKKADASNTYTKAEVNAAIDAKQIEVDDTLSITGTAADAKAVGDKLMAVKADLNDKVDLPSNGYGSSGKVLRSTGTGTEWAAVGQPTDEQATGAVATWLAAHPEATTTVQDRAITASKLSNDLVIGRIDNYVSPMEFGAVGDGVTDDTAAFAAAEESEKGIIYVPKGVYKVSGITTEKSIIMDSEAWLTTDIDRANVVTITGDNQVYRLNLRLKNTYAHAGVIVDGDYNHFEQIIIDGLNYDGVTLYPDNRINVGVSVNGTHNTFDFVRMYDFVQDYAGNDSAPQGIALNQNANFNSFDNFVIDNCRAGVVNAALHGTINRFNNISVTGCGDNGVYCVRGGKMEIGTLMHEGTNECLAVITDTYEEGTTTDDELTSVSVGSIFSSGDYDFPLRIKNAGYINIGRFDVAADIGDIIFVNRENVHSAGISIDSLTFRGSCTCAIFLPESRGELEYLNINNIEILDNHKNSAFDMTSSATSSYFLLTMAKSVNIGHANVTIKDAEGAYETAIVRMRIEVKSGVKESSIRNLDLKIISIRGEGSIDIINAKQNGLDIIEGQILHDNDSNLIRLYNDDRYRGRIYSRLPPQYGTWRVGDIVISDRDNTLAVGTIGWICIVAGTPGTWKELKMFPFTGATRYDNGNLQYWSGSIGGGSWQNIS